VHSQTGFEDIKELLSFAAVACCGDFLLLTKSVSYLSWIEEWFFYFEMVYGRSCLRWADFARNYKISAKNFATCVQKQATACHSSQA